jgi:hypothetical protein
MNDKLSGILIHLVANQRDENIPHETSFQYHEWKEKKSELSVLSIGNITNTKYIQGHLQLPNFIINHPCVSQLRSNLFLRIF